MAVARSESMQLVAYALSRCGEQLASGGPTLPPPWLRVRTWKEAYDLFYDHLGDGRTSGSFRNSLKNSRDAFDAHLKSGRRGWRDETGKPRRKDPAVNDILLHWESRSDDELRRAVEAILDGAEGRPEEQEEARVRTEGGVSVVLVKKRERDDSLRRDALRIHGTSWMACGFSFGKAYGPHGDGYIEVHHAMPLAEYGQRDTDPATDLLVLCANCHRMIHRNRAVCLTLEELKGKLLANP